MTKGGIAEILLRECAEGYVIGADGHYKDIVISGDGIQRIVDAAIEYERQRIIAFNVRAMFGHDCRAPTIEEVIARPAEAVRKAAPQCYSQRTKQ